MIQAEPHSHVLRPWNGTAIILMDLDAFFASVEQLDHPEWKGKPSSSEEIPQNAASCPRRPTRHVNSAYTLPCPHPLQARLCPQAIWAPGNFHRYRELSQKVRTILQDESPHLMQVSIDEAFLDITPTRTNREHPCIRSKTHSTTRCRTRHYVLDRSWRIESGGKIASNQNKPRGLTVVYPGESAAFLAPLPVAEMSGIGPVAQKSLTPTTCAHWGT